MLYRLLVLVHVLAACVWVGGISFFALVLVPVLRRQRDTRAAGLVQAVGRRFRVVGWVSVALLIVTGIANVLWRVPAGQMTDAAFWTSAWGALLAVKLALVVVMLVIGVLHDVVGSRASALALRDPASAETRQQRALASALGRVLGLLVLGILLVAVLLVRGV